MIRRSLFAAAFTLLSVPVFGQGADIEATIQNQIQAFRTDDFSKAFKYASPMIQGIFGNPGSFGEMVQNGFPMVYRPKEIRFLDLRNINGRLFQKVMIRDTTDRIHILDYQMIEGENGWRINGVQILTPPQVGA